MNDPKVLIAIPCMRTVCVEFFDSILHLKNNGNTYVALESSSLVYDARNHLCLKAFEKQCDYIMWLDSDMVFPPETVVELIRIAEEEKADLVTGLYFKRVFPTQPVLAKQVKWSQGKDGVIDSGAEVYVDYPKDQLFPIEGCGLGCALVRVSTIDEVGARTGMSPFQPLPYLSEDYSFCFRLKQLGKKMLCDSRIKVGHVGNMIFDESTWIGQEREQK